MSGRGLPRAIFPAALVTGILLLWSGTHAPEAAEPWLVRWLRTAAEHPLRTGLALTLLAFAARSERRPEAE